MNDVERPGADLLIEPAGQRRAEATLSLLMDLRPCYEGFAGIPQEARLLFAMFAAMQLGQLGGLASGIHFVSKRRRRIHSQSAFSRTFEQTTALIAQDTKRHHAPLSLTILLPARLRRHAARAYLVAAFAGRADPLDLQIDREVFEDYLWTKLFERTLGPEARRLLGNAKFLATEIGHENARHLSFLPRPLQHRLDTAKWDIFLGCTVSPYRVSPNTAMIIRYYDPLPLLSPHTVGEPWPHARSHARMLLRNMEQGATFICGSEPVREDLLRLFPEAERRTLTIPCLLAPDYAPDVRPIEELTAVLARRASSASAPKISGARKAAVSEMPTARFIMAVSTLEPRKNYLRLFRAFEIARRKATQPIQLLIVANPGWRSDAELAELKMLVAEGAHHLEGVPVSELRMLYSMAHLVAAPSRAEGFDYSGIEAMSCGTPVLASDTAVHRWVYGDAAEFIDAYNTEAWGIALARLADLPRDQGKLADMRERGLKQAALYRSEALVPRWETALLGAVTKPRK